MAAAVILNFQERYLQQISILAPSALDLLIKIIVKDIGFCFCGHLLVRLSRNLSVPWHRSSNPCDFSGQEATADEGLDKLADPETKS